MNKVLHVYDHGLPHQSGYVFRSLTLRQAQERAGLKTDGITGVRQYSADKEAFSPPSREVFQGLTFYRTPSHGVKLPVLRELSDIRALANRIADLVKQNQYDVIHAHSPLLNYFAARRALKMTGRKIPLVYEIRAFWEDAAADHGTTKEGSLRYQATRYLETLACRGADYVYTICEGLRADLIARGIPKNKIGVIPNTIDIKKFPPLIEKDTELLKTLNLEGKVILGFIGSFYKYEGLIDMPALIKKLAESLPNIMFLAVGGGIDEPNIRAKVKEYGVENYFLFTGRVPNEEVNRYYSLCDALVFPRLKMRLTETVTPLKPLECMASKKIVFASDIGGHRELIRDGETGFLIQDFKNVSVAAEKIAKVLQDHEALAKIREAGRQYIETERDADAIVKRYALYPPYARLFSEKIG